MEFRVCGYVTIRINANVGCCFTVTLPRPALRVPLVKIWYAPISLASPAIVDKPLGDRDVCALKH